MVGNLSPQVIERIRSLYPQFMFMLEEPDAGGYGADLVALLIKASDPTAPYTQERFNTEYKQTAYYNRADVSSKNFDKQTKVERDALVRAKSADIKATYGDLYRDPANLLRVATSAARQGLTGNSLRYFVFASAATVGEGPQVGQTALADKLRKDVAAYGYRASDEQINAALTGKAVRGQVYTQDSLIKMAKIAAKGTYGHLAPQIDAGLSLDDIFGNYRNFAAEILEIDPNEIDFTKDPKYAEAFGDSKTGQLSLSAWVKKLKTDDQYGWKFTNQANQQVSSMVSTLEKAFGLVR